MARKNQKKEKKQQEKAFSNPAHWLEEEFKKRQEKNSHYSLRAFSRALGLSSGRVSELISGKRIVTLRAAELIAEKLVYSPEKKQEWLEIVQSYKESKKRSQQISVLMRASEKTEEYSLLSSDQFYVMADWHHLAILSLLKTDDCQASIPWMAKRLNLTQEEVTMALQRLERLELIRKEGSHWIRTKSSLTTTHDLPSSALRRANKQILHLAEEALDSQSVLERDITSIIMAISPSKIPIAKQMIKNFRRAMADLLMSGEKKEVYAMNIALFPMSFRSKRKETFQEKEKEEG